MKLAISAELRAANGLNGKAQCGINNIGGADRTFACKSQECLWQDWYIYNKVGMGRPL